MYHVDEVKKGVGETRVTGWLYENGKSVSRCRYEENGKRFALRGYGKSSADLVKFYGEDAAKCRFEFLIPRTNPKGYLVFKYKSGGSTVIPLVSRSESQNQITARTHQFFNGRYFGRFELVEGLKVKMVILSTGAPDDPNALLIKKKQFRFEPNSNILCLSSGLRADWRIDDLNIFFTLNDKTVICLFDVGKSGRKDSQAFKIEDDFFSWLESRDESLTLVEIGSRARSGNTFRDRIPGRHQFVGVDLMEGTNVDVVADAHSLSLQIEHNSIDAVFGVSVFEHLAMPWKVAIELNTIMRMGARGMFVTHQAWPLHDDPFDFWRYSKDSWHAIFNRSSGFKIIDAAIGDRAQIFAELQTQDTFFPSDCFCYLVSSVLIEKTSDTELSWDVPLDEIYQGEYPE